MRGVHVVVEGEAEEEKYDRHVDLVVLLGTFMVQEQKAALFIILDVLEVHGWLPVRGSGFWFRGALHRSVEKIVLFLLERLLEAVKSGLRSIVRPDRAPAVALDEKQRRR